MNTDSPSNFRVALDSNFRDVNGNALYPDFDLTPLKHYIDNEFDHRHLNDVLGHDKTTAECLAKHFYDWCKANIPETSSVKVSETPRAWAEYRP